MADQESEEETKRRQRSAAQKAFFRQFVTDDEFRRMANILRISAEDDKIREQIGLAIYFASEIKRPKSRKEERINLQNINNVSSHLLNILEESMRSTGD